MIYSRIALAARIVLSLLLLATPAWADWTITNYNGGSGYEESDRQVSHYDLTNNAIDAHEGQILQVGSDLYRYGEAMGGGAMYGTASAWGGIHVYHSTITDAGNWQDYGFLFNAATSFWQNRCANIGPASSPGGSCFEPHVLYNTANNNFVFWMGQGANATTSSAAGALVFTSTTPWGEAYGCPTTPGYSCPTPGTITPQADPSGFADAWTEMDALFEDTDGTEYMLYNSAVSPVYAIRVVTLNAAYTAPVTTTATGLTGEGGGMFKLGSTYYILHGGTGCGYCNTDRLYYATASSAAATYSADTTLNVGSCGGQIASVDKIVAGANTTYLVTINQWFQAVGGGGGMPNQGLGNLYEQPLSFTGTAIDTVYCQTTVTVPGLTTTAPPAWTPTPDQTDVQDGFTDNLLADATVSRLQIFVPTDANLAAIGMPMGQVNETCKVGTTCPGGLNGDVVVNLWAVDGSYNRTTKLASVTVPYAGLSWAPKWTVVTFNYSGLTPMTPYGYEVTTAATQGAVIGARRLGATNLYPAGVERLCVVSTGICTTDINGALMFSTFGSNLAPAGGGRRGLFR